MAQGVLAALTGGEQATLAAAIAVVHDGIDAVIALGYPAYSAYAAASEKEILFNDKCKQIHDLCDDLTAAVTLLNRFKREK